MSLFSKNEERNKNKSNNSYLEIIKRASMFKKNVNDVQKYKSNKLDTKKANLVKKDIFATMDSIKIEMNKETNKSPGSINIEKIKSLQEQFKLAEKKIAGIDRSIESKKTEKKSLKQETKDKIKDIKNKRESDAREKREKDIRALKNSAKGHAKKAKNVAIDAAKGTKKGLTIAVGALTLAGGFVGKSIKEFVHNKKLKALNNDLNITVKDKLRAETARVEKKHKLSELISKHKALSATSQNDDDYFADIAKSRDNEKAQREIELEASKVKEDIARLTDDINRCDNSIEHYENEIYELKNPKEKLVEDFSEKL